MQPYSYSLLRYLHDPSLGEAVNVGVLIYAPDASWVRFVGAHRTKALSTLFRDFDRRDFLLFLSRLEASAERFAGSLSNAQKGLFQMGEKPRDAAELARWLMPDNELRFQFSDVRTGLTENPVKTAHQIAQRILINQRPTLKNRVRRNDDAVWASFQPAFKEVGVEGHLTPHVVETSEFALPFQHAYKNGNWHAIEAISFDYARSDEIRDHAMLWYSYGAALSESEDFASLTLLLGPPSKKEYQRSYENARKWLSKMPIPIRIVEEKQADQFAIELAQRMKEEGVMKEDQFTENSASL